MAKRRKTVEIYAPTIGIKADAPSEMLDPRAVSSGQNFKCFFGLNQKEYGTTIWATGTTPTVSGAPTMIFSATFPTISVLEVITPTNVYQYVAGSDSYTNDGQTFTSTYTDFWSGLMYNNTFIYGNGVGNLQYKTAYNSTGTNMPSAVTPTTFNAWGLLAINGFLNLYHTFENQTEYYKRVRWSAQGPLVYSAGTTDFASGVAGAQDIDDGEGNLMAAVPLAGGAALYFENSIHYQSFVGGDAVWNFQKMIPGVGVPGRRCAFGYQEVNYLLTLNNIYRYYGGYYLDPIGEPIKKYLFSEFNQAAANTAWLDFDKHEAELLVYIPTGTATQPDVCWVYRVADQAWSRKSRKHSSSGYFSKQSGLTIGQLVGPIGGQNFTFGEAAVKISASVKLYGDPSGRVVAHDTTVYSLSQTGTNIAQTYTYDTPDITGNRKVDPMDNSQDEFVITYQRWQRANIAMKGNGTANVSYSTDHGNTYATFAQSPVTLVAQGTNYLLDMDISNPYIRLRIENTGLNDFLAVSYVKLDFIPGPPF